MFGCQFVGFSRISYISVSFWRPTRLSVCFWRKDLWLSSNLQMVLTTNLSLTQKRMPVSPCVSYGDTKKSDRRCSADSTILWHPDVMALEGQIDYPNRCARVQKKRIPASRQSTPAAAYPILQTGSPGIWACSGIGVPAPSANLTLWFPFP